jgi:hypothetical protein
MMTIAGRQQTALQSHAPSPAAVVVLECWQHHLVDKAAQEVRHQLQGGQASRQGREVCMAQ